MTRGNTVRVIADGTTTSLPAVREATAQVLDDWQVDTRRADALLVVDELVANSGRHVGGDVVIDLTLQGDVLRIVVSDRDPDFRIHSHRPATERYGLRIVDASVDRWGVAAIAGDAVGKAVWAEFDLSAASLTPD